MKAVEIIEGAIKKLNEGEWCQGWLSISAEGKFVGPRSPECHARCAMGAMFAAMPRERFEMIGDNEVEALTAESAVARVIRAKYPDQPLSFEDTVTITWFNDHVATTEEDVVLIFEEAVKLLRDAEALEPAAFADATPDPATVSVIHGGIGDTNGFFLPPHEDTHSVRV